MSYRARLLGFAFTNADFLFEVNGEGIIQFAAGAANDLVKESGEALVGRPAGRLFKPSESAKFATFTKALKAGHRAGPYKLLLATGAEASLAMFRLPDNGANISCTLARPGRAAPSAKIDPQTGLFQRDEFLAAAERAGSEDLLTLVDVPGLPDLCAILPSEGADALMLRIGESLQSSGATASGRISDTGFGAVAPVERGNLDLAQKLADILTASGLIPPTVAETRMSLNAPNLSPEQRILSMRYVLNRFANQARMPNTDIGSAFASMMEETQHRLAAMTRTVGDGAFEIAYQPIADLVTGRISHYEALARFANPEGTGETVKFIEALGIANSFDLAVANKVLALIEQLPEAQIAFNVSGETIASPESFGMFAAMLAKRRRFAPRTLIEITETSRIVDLEGAGKAIQVLRNMGYRVGLDDFGAGAASVNYLHAFQVDFVKFDGAMIQKIGTSKRDDALLAGLAKLCSELGTTAIAEWIETKEMADAARAMGFRHGQGKWLGAPTKEIPTSPQANGKRQGVKESWG
jgi:EAL domain-containing protein (putative c-di-GMP-specific phosphodiesterase class I)